MPQLIKIKRGLSTNIGNLVLQQGEFAITTDTDELYVGVDGTTTKHLLNGIPTNTSTANKLATARTISSTGDVIYNITFDGSQNVSGTATLSDTGISAGTYKSVTVDSKGRVTAGTNPTTLAGYGITDGLLNTSTIDGGTF